MVDVLEYTILYLLNSNTFQYCFQKFVLIFTPISAVQKTF